MEEIIIYTAGNPDLYPIEYYDADTDLSGSDSKAVKSVFRTKQL